MTMKRIIREPLTHFFVLGAALFFTFGWLNGGDMQAPDEILVDETRIADLAARFERTWQRPPTPEELQGLIESWVREEIHYREGLALGLDRDDPVVRRRIAQKMDFLADGLAPDSPTEAELQTWLDENAKTYRIPARYSFRQIYFDPEHQDDDPEARIAAARERLAADGEALPGDATLLPARLADADAFRVARVLGSDFADALARLPVGEWAGPVRSSYGLHLVRIESVEPARMPALAEVRAAVERDLLNARADEISEVFYQSLRKRYTVRIEPGPRIAGSR